MSSMWRLAAAMAVLLAAVSSGAAQYLTPSPTPVVAASYRSQSIAAAIESWRALRQSSGYRFADYAGFLIANPDWPDAARMRNWAEKAMQPGEDSSTVLAFFAIVKPKTGNGWARLAEVYLGSARTADALDAARHAWRSADLSGSDEQLIWSRFGNGLSRSDHDDRIDSLLFAKKPDDAARFLSMASPERQAAFSARIAMQLNASDAESRYAPMIGSVTRDAGLMMDRGRYLREHSQNAMAQQLFARDHNFTFKPADAERFMDMQVVLAGDAIDARDWQTAYNIASGIDDVLPSGAIVSEQPVAVRDNYTTLAWYAGTVAADRLNHPRSAIAMFDRYAQGGKSLQVQTKGNYWAARAALAAGQGQQANSYFERAAAYPDLFYGQLALERLGRSVPAPPAAQPQYTTTQADRDAFNSRRLVQAVKVLGQQGRSAEQALFVKSLAESLDTDKDRNLAVALGDQIGRQDLAVWTSRLARVKGSSFYVRQAYPRLPTSVSGQIWSLAHGISRQESSFDPYAISHAGALGMMQLMGGTARDEARKIGVGYDNYRLIRDPSYNVTLGSSYFSRLLSTWNGSVPLAVAAYNAGSGNVRKWINRSGDPRGQVDVLKWIEAIPYNETRAYVQRVIENSVVYDSMRSGDRQQAALHVSRYLGKSQPG